MNSIRNFIKYLQDKPLETRTRRLWASSAVAGVLVFGIWVNGFKKQISNLNISSVTKTDQTSVAESRQHYISVDSKTEQDGKTMLYFSLQNDTTDILSFSKASDISLTINDKEYKPTQITTRTNQPFIQKALSGSHTFGILTFENVPGGAGTLSFDSLYFEQSPQSIFKEVIEINLNKLGKPEQIRE